MKACIKKMETWITSEFLFIKLDTQKINVLLNK